MVQPKKLTQAQKFEKKQKEKLASYKIQLIRLRMSLGKTNDPTTFRWAALELFKELRTEFPETSTLIESYKTEALNIAREAQAIMNFF